MILIFKNWNLRLFFDLEMKPDFLPKFLPKLHLEIYFYDLDDLICE